MACEDDSFQHISVNAGDDNKMLLWKIQENSVLVVVVDKTLDRDVYVPHIEEALEIVEQGTEHILMYVGCLIESVFAVTCGPYIHCHIHIYLNSYTWHIFTIILCLFAQCAPCTRRCSSLKPIGS